MEAINPALAYTIAGFVNGDTSAAVTGSATLTTLATSTSNLGPYAITFGREGLAATSYTFTYVAGTLTINAAPTAVPIFSMAAGTYTTSQTITMTDATTGSAIYYTTNGTTPTTSSTHYTAAVTVSATETIKAITTGTNYWRSPVATAAYTITPPAAAIISSRQQQLASIHGILLTR